MSRTLLVGGTGLLGRHTAASFLDAGDAVASLSRGNRDGDLDAAVTRFEGDRRDPDTLRRVRDAFDPDVVVDLVGRFPVDVDAALDVFRDAESFVYVSSTSVYAPPHHLPSREADPLHECTPEQAVDESMSTYGNRKAECDRLVRAAADDGVAATVVRPVVIYGPGDWSGRHDYWFDRVRRFDRIVVPGDGGSAYHRVFAPDAADAIRLVAEHGDPGAAYNVAERDTPWLDRTVDLAADALDTEVEAVHANARELATVDLTPDDFPLYAAVPLVCSSARLAALGWTSTPPAEAIAASVDAFLAGDVGAKDVDHHDYDVDRDAERRLVERLTG